MIGQYRNSDKFVVLDTGLTSAFNEFPVLKDWYDVYYNVSTASGAGLDWWGKRLNQSRNFEYQGNNYYLQGAQTIDGVSYTDEEMENFYRKTLQIKAMSYVSNLTLFSINQMLKEVFSEQGRSYCIEVINIEEGVLINTGTMQIRYVFEFYMSKVFKAIAESLLPHPSGVLTSFEYLPIGEFLGFYVQNEVTQPYGEFNQKTFYK